MNLAILASIAYGILALVGGVMGYRKAQSQMSLISGAVSGALLIFAGILQLLGVAQGVWLATIVTIALLVVFAIRLSKTRAFMPAGLMLVTGAVALAVLLWNPVL